MYNRNLVSSAIILNLNSECFCTLPISSTTCCYISAFFLITGNYLCYASCFSWLNFVLPSCLLQPNFVYQITSVYMAKLCMPIVCYSQNLHYMPCNQQFIKANFCIPQPSCLLLPNLEYQIYQLFIKAKLYPCPKLSICNWEKCCRCWHACNHYSSRSLNTRSDLKRAIQALHRMTIPPTSHNSQMSINVFIPEERNL